MEISETYIVQSIKGRNVKAFESLDKAFKLQDELLAKGVRTAIIRRVVMDQDIGRSFSPIEVPRHQEAVRIEVEREG